MEKGKKIIAALVGIMLIGMGVAFNAQASLGNDTVGILYDGLRNILGVSMDNLGNVSNIVNFIMIVIVFIVGKKYINIGTFIYVLPFGIFVDMGNTIYSMLNIEDIFICNLLTGIVGCLLVYVGVAIYIVADIGLDPFSGFVMVMKDKLSWGYRRAKLVFDISTVIIGIMLGGTWGIVTIICMLSAAPMIQICTNILGKIEMFRVADSTN